MGLSPTPIRPIYEMPDHKHYGPVRRTWMMLEQIFADRSGVRAVELAIEAYQKRGLIDRPRWDTHLGWLIDQGQSEPAAQRIVLQQMLVAFEFIR